MYHDVLNAISVANIGKWKVTLGLARYSLLWLQGWNRYIFSNFRQTLADIRWVCWFKPILVGFTNWCTGGEVLNKFYLVVSKNNQTDMQIVVATDAPLDA